MILLDTNVLSEPWKPVPDLRVLAWLDAQTADTLHLAAITVAELRLGVAVLPVGKRRDLLDRRLEQELLPLFEGRILAFDLRATRAYADVMASAKRRGRAIGIPDALIAATAAVNGLMVATRDTAPFAAAGLNTIDPWR